MRMRRALILKIEEKVAELSGSPMHADETALVGALVGAPVRHPGGHANVDLGQLHIFSVRTVTSWDF